MKLGSFVVTSWPTFQTLVDVHANTHKQYPTCKFCTFLIFHWSRRLDQAAHALNKCTKRRTNAYFAMWVTLKYMLRHAESFGEKLHGQQFFGQPHSFARGMVPRRAESRPLFQNVPGCVLNHLHFFCCSRMSINALKTNMSRSIIGLKEHCKLVQLHWQARD